MNNIIYDDEIITPEYYIYEYYEKFIKKLNKRDCVKFALFCVKYLNPNTKESNHCIALVEKWLINENSVTKKELYNAVLIIHHPNYNYNDASLSTVYNVANTTWNAYNNFTSNTFYHTIRTVVCFLNSNNHNANDLNLYLKTLLRITKQYNTTNHNNQHYESILKEIIKEDIDKLTDTDYNMLIDISQEYYNINPNITNKRILIELLRREYAVF